MEAVAVAQVIDRIPPSQASEIWLGEGQHIGNHYPEDFGSGVASISNFSVAVTGKGLTEGILRLPRLSEKFELPVTQLMNLGQKGPYDMAIKTVGPFDIKKTSSALAADYPALWNHKTSEERRLVVKPDSEGLVKPGEDKRAIEIWGKAAARLHYNRDFQTSSQALGACLTKQPAMGGTAWPSFLCKDRNWDFPLVLWANTTLGLIAFWWIGTRQQQGRSRITISKLPELHVLDARKMSSQQLDLSKEIFKKFENRSFLPANEAYGDDVRKQLDKAVLVDLLNLPEEILEPLEKLRLQWCCEPTVHGNKTTRPGGEKGHPFGEIDYS